jgi:peptidoglycan/LPS O-acetylase OafA/YrhL
VLSGYVLTLSLTGSHFDVRSITRFYIRRIFRIYPAIIAVTLVSALYLLMLHNQFPTLTSSDWFKHSYRAGYPNVEGFVLSLTGWRNEFIPPLWTVRIEIFASLAMPLLAFLIKMNLGLPLIVATTLLLFLGSSSSWMYLICFVLGGYVAHIGPRLRKHANVYLLVAATLMMYFFRLLSPEWRFEINNAALLPTYVESLSAAIIVSNIAALNVSFLRSKALVWLGDISFSVYLVHFVILATWAKLIGRAPVDIDVKALMLMMATLVTTLPVAHYCYRFIELPGIALGKDILNRFAGKPVVVGEVTRQG